MEKENIEQPQQFSMKDTNPLTNKGKIRHKANPRREAKNIMAGISKPIKVTEPKEVRLCKILQKYKQCQCFKLNGQCEIIRAILEVW